MTNEQTTKIIDFELKSCPKCNKAHEYKLKGIVQQKVIEKVSLFGGPGAVEGDKHTDEILFTCPETKRKFTQLVPKMEGVEIIGLASKEDIAEAENSTVSSQVKSEFEEWTKKSRETALDFSKMMLSASTGGIPIYFAVLKYIGFEKIGNTSLSQFTIIPPVLFIHSCYHVCICVTSAI